ncbi:MAG: hypothetical protein WBQ69_10595 [Gallionella sp.]
MSDKISAKPPETNISELLRKGNLAQAEIFLRIFLANEPNNPEALFALGKIAREINLPHFALHYFGEAIKFAPEWQLPKINRDRVSRELSEIRQQAGQTERFLLIKAWGYGFWSDVSHVLGQLLLAEITGRTPVVYWGTNSLFGDGTSANAFEFYFEPISRISAADLQREDLDFWPPKWNRNNLLAGEINKWGGPYSRMAGLYLLGRSESVVVSDFFTNVADLIPWIPAGHHLHGLSVDQVWLYLVRRYLHPKKEIMDAVERFYDKHLGSPDFMSVHIRGSDKVIEVGNLDELNKQYKQVIDRCLASGDLQKIFLMTDDSRLLDFFRQTYGSSIIATDCRRTDNAKGVHHLDVSDRRQLGIEVMVDVYLAGRARFFVGNGTSNPSLFVRYLKDWPAEAVHLVGDNWFHKPNPKIHNW